MSPLVTRPSLPVPANGCGIRFRFPPRCGAPTALAARRRKLSRARAPPLSAPRRERQPLSLRGRRGFRRCFRAARAFGDRAEHRADGDRVAVLHRDFREHARDRRRALRPSPCRFRVRPAARRPKPRRPAFLNQRPIVASVTDSPSVGTLISMLISSILRVTLASARRRGRLELASGAWT